MLTIQNTDTDGNIRYCFPCDGPKEHIKSRPFIKPNATQTSKSIKCEFCGENHHCKNCNIEKQMKKTLTKNIGRVIEDFIAQNMECRDCRKMSLYYLNDNTPSSDIKCSECGKIIEVKSKCLSVQELPDNIHCRAGNFNHFKKNIEEHDLDLIIVIYSVDRKTKCITFREIYYFYNEALINIINMNLLSIKEVAYSSLINIKDRTLLSSYKLPIRNLIVISLENYINNLTCQMNLKTESNI